jgi:thioredoxin-like negative regulator of GroEL
MNRLAGFWLIPDEVHMGIFAKLFGPKPPVVLPVLVDDWSPLCGPCKQLEPVIMRLAGHYQGRIKVAEINASASPKTMQKLFITATPTVVYFKKGNEVERVEGFRGELYHREFIDNELLDPPANVSAGAARASSRSSSSARV